MSKLQELDRYFNKHGAVSSSVATHIYWTRPRNTPLWCTLPDAESIYVSKSIAIAFFQSFEGVKFTKGLPCVHEIGKELFPFFIDIDDVPLSCDIKQMKALVSGVLTYVSQYAMDLEGATAMVYVNNPRWIVHSEAKRPPPQDEGQKKYGIHVYLDSKFLVTSAMMFPLAHWLNEKIRNNCQQHKHLSHEERKQFTECVLCRVVVDTKLYENALPKLRMPFCDKGFPYPNRFYGLACRLQCQVNSGTVSIFF